VNLSTAPLCAENWSALEELFGRSGASNGCWCMYWRIGPRYHQRPRVENHDERRRLATSGHVSGLLAFDDQLPIGWCELAPRAEFHWLAHARFLDPVDEMPVWAVPCFYVRRSHRGRGVSGHLIDAAVRRASASSAGALEAYPIDTAAQNHTRNLFPGVASTFAARGFETVARRRPDRPIMRRILGPASEQGRLGQGDDSGGDPTQH
jgi:GNAT superfamily N-acetyltransferase